ncbi:MAG: DUF6438 domain-containing protein [Bacteroidia bacterium]
MKPVCMLGLLVLAISSCGGPRAIRQTEVPQDFELSLERSICFGRCPAYRLEVNPEGDVEYEPLRFAPDSSKVPERLTKRQLKEMVYVLNQADLSQYHDSYDAEVSDLPSVELYCKLQDLEKQILMRYQTPAKLDTLVLDLEKIIFGRHFIHNQGG